MPWLQRISVLLHRGLLSLNNSFQACPAVKTSSEKFYMLRLGTILTFMQNVIRPRKRRSFVQKPTTFVKSFTTQTQIFRYKYYSLLHDVLLHLNIAMIILYFYLLFFQLNLAMMFFSSQQLGDTTICVVKQGSLHKTRLSEGGKKYR